MNKPLESTVMKEFGFCPEPVEVKVGPVTIQPFRDTEKDSYVLSLAVLEADRGSRLMAFFCETAD